MVPLPEAVGPSTAMIMRGSCEQRFGEAEQGDDGPYASSTIEGRLRFTVSDRISSAGADQVQAVEQVWVCGLAGGE